MSSNNFNDSSSVRDNSNLKSIYSKFQNFLGRGSLSCSDSRKEMLSSRASTVASDESFVTSMSSVDDLMALSPKKKNIEEQSDMTSDFLTGTEMDSICDVTMQDLPTYDDMFIDVDYLVKRSGSNLTNNLDSGKDSLFVKFDPLYARKLDRSISAHSQSITDSTECDGGYETGSTISVFTDVAPLKHTISAGAMLTTGIKDRPMQVVPPVVNSEVLKPSINTTRSTPALVRSVSAILAPTQVATERLISISGSTPPTAAPRSPRFSSYSSHDVDRHESLRVILRKQDQEVLNLRQENRELKSLLQDDQHRHMRHIEELDSKVKKLTEDKEHLLERENKLLHQINEKNLNNKQMSIVMEEYEKTISSLIGEQHKDKKTTMDYVDKLTYERDQALNHLSSMESSFNDLLSKYEKCKGVILETKEREKTYEEKLAEYEAGIKKYESLYNTLKEVTTDNLTKANETLENLKKSHNVELTKLNAVIKKHEITIASLQESVIQKTRDNEELTRICDELINDVR